MKYEIAIPSLMAKPRMTRQDKWKKRPATTAYWMFKDELVWLCQQCGYRLEKSLYAVCYIQMPESWSKKKKDSMDGTRHEAKPDADNFCKGFLDCLRPDGDSMVTPTCVHKVWASESRVVFFDSLKEWYEHVANLDQSL